MSVIAAVQACAVESVGVVTTLARAAGSAARTVELVANLGENTMKVANHYVLSQMQSTTIEMLADTKSSADIMSQFVTKK